MIRLKLRIEIGIATVLTAVFTVPALAQFIGNSPGSSLQKAPPVQFVSPEQVHVTAGKRAAVVLHFRVAEGMHVNSHTPRENFLIPTTFSIPAGEGVRLESASYPSGSDIALSSAPKTKLNVYSDDFAVEARIVVAPGNHLVRGVLHFQACNETQCLPPQTITAAVDMIAK